VAIWAFIGIVGKYSIVVDTLIIKDNSIINHEKNHLVAHNPISHNYLLQELTIVN